MLMLQLQAPKAQNVSEWAPDEPTGFRLPVPGRAECSSQLSTAETQEICAGNTQSGRQSTMTDTTAGLTCAAGRVWRGGGSDTIPQVLLSLVTFLGACQEDSSRALTTCSRMSGQ